MNPAPYIQLLRPKQWIKNGFCFAGLIFSGRLFEIPLAFDAVRLFIAFCLASAAVYVLNDILDAPSDRHHPRKRLRPVASGQVPPRNAWALLAGLAVVLALFLFSFNMLTVGAILAYLLNNLLYNLLFKKHIIIDVMSIGFGFVLRLLGGIYVIGEVPTAWITICTFFLALYLGFSKRIVELKAATNGDADLQRKSLGSYTPAMLDKLLNGTSIITVTSYALFTVTSHLNSTLILTLPFVYYGIMYFECKTLANETNEALEEVLLRDHKLQVIIACWLLVYIAIFYWDIRLFAY